MVTVAKGSTPALWNRFCAGSFSILTIQRDAGKYPHFEGAVLPDADCGGHAWGVPVPERALVFGLAKRREAILHPEDQAWMLNQAFEHDT